jgi:hypothetical protein
MEERETGASEQELYTDEYEFMVRQCAKNRLPLDLRNRHIDHAVVLTRHILAESRERASFLTGRLHQEFSDSIREELADALKRGCGVDVVFVEHEPVPSAVAGLRGRYPDRLRLYRVRDEHRERLRQSGHFCVSDGCRYRMENHHPFDQDFARDKAVTAVANFNRPDIARKLERLFATTREMSEELAS